MTDDQTAILKSRGLLVLNVMRPARSPEGWFTWKIAPAAGCALENCRCYIDGSPLNGRWREISYTGSSIVLTKQDGPLVAYGCGAPQAGSTPQPLLRRGRFPTCSRCHRVRHECLLIARLLSLPQEVAPQRL